MSNDAQPNPWLSYFNLSNHYERKARFLPGILSIMVLLPLATAAGVPLLGWITFILAGLGLGAVAAVGISHLSSAAGNRLQSQLWPRWPHDAPTNRWLHPSDTSRSTQYKSNLYSAIKRLANLDIPAVASTTPNELEAVINDAVSSLRYKLRSSPHADRLNEHNADYGFARNFTGLRPFWLSFSVANIVGCSLAYRLNASALSWLLISIGLAVALFLVAKFMLPTYVRQRASHYAESFFSAILEVDHALNESQTNTHNQITNKN